MRKSSFTLEYAVMIAIIVAALVGMSIYLRRAVFGKWREAVDTIGFGRQYDPHATH